jgi:hypothetical protein
MLVSDDVFRREIEGVVARLEQLADALANDGLLHASGTALAGRQAIRALCTRPYPVVEAPSALKSVPPDEPGADTGAGTAG